MNDTQTQQTDKTVTGNFFEDFTLGQEIVHATPRTVTVGDVALFTALYGPRFAVQSSDAFAHEIGYPRAPIDDLLVFHVVIGKTGRRISEADAKDHIAGYAVLNDVSMRDYQFRTIQWLQGKTWEKSTPFGPALVTTDEFSAGPLMTSAVDGEIQQSTPTGDLVFTPEFLVSYISTIITLNPGDVIATGTPGGVGHAQDPKRYLQEGQLLVTTIEGLGQLTNRVIKEA